MSKEKQSVWGRSASMMEVVRAFGDNKSSLKTLKAPEATN